MKENNELIAEFMGVEYKKDHTNRKCWHYDELNLTSDKLSFDTSWCWLMPVVEKIDRLGYSVTILRTRTIIETVLTGRIVESIHPEYSMIEVTYQAVIEFIHYYNTTKQQEQKQPHESQDVKPGEL